MSEHGADATVSLAGVVLDAPDPAVLADFYRQLLGWRVTSSDDDWVVLTPPGGGPTLAFQREPHYRPPSWPSRPDRQQMMIHLDLKVRDLDAAHRRAVTLGAAPAEWQPQPTDEVRVFTDPVGHVFCLFV